MAFHKIIVEPGTSIVGVLADELLKALGKYLTGGRKMPCLICHEPIDIPRDFEEQIKAVTDRASSQTAKIIFTVARTCSIPNDFKPRFYKADDPAGGEEARARRKATSDYLFKRSEEGKRKYQK